MRNIFSLTILGLGMLTQAQVIIGDGTGTAPVGSKGSVLLEFANTNNKGIVLPYLRTVPTASTANQGSIFLDASGLKTARVKYSNGSNMIDLSGQDADVTTVMADQPVESTSLDNGKTIIGASTSDADGVLVLESTTKAMVLPIVTDFTNIKNPAPGMMALLDTSASGDTAAVRATKLRLIVFNGSKWSFWKP